MSTKIVAAASVILTVLVTGHASATGFEIIAPHRAVYDVSLIKSSERSGIKSMTGRIVYELRGNGCEGVSLKYRFLSRVTTISDQFLSDQQTSTFESADGTQFNFVSKSLLNGQLEEVVKGKAQQRADSLLVTLESPPPRQFEFSSAQFMTSYLVNLIELAKKGEHHFRGDLYDGSDGGDETVSTAAFISNAKSIADTKDKSDAQITNLLSEYKAWPVAMSYFDRETGATAEHLPMFESSFLLFENGISTDLVLRYPDYSLSGKLSELVMFETADCQ